MQSRVGSVLTLLAAALFFSASPFSSCAQQTAMGAGAAGPASATGSASLSPDAIPNAPAPEIELAAGGFSGPAQTDQNSAPATDSGSQSTQPPGANSDPAPTTTNSGTNNSTTQTSSSSQESQRDKAAQQIKEQEQQRVVGVVPAFNTSYVWNAASMTADQKLGLALRAAVDPFQFGAAFLVAGYHEALDEDPGFGWGAQGYFKRSGAAYLDAFDGDLIGNGILPAVLHQDPRYFRMGPSHGSVRHRLLYALATNVISRHDSTGKWEPNYSNVGGNIIAGAISNLYYPSQNSGWGQTISNGMIVTAEGGIGSIFQEFWPDISRKVLHKDPTHGADARAVAEKARSNGARDAASSDPSGPDPGSGSAPGSK